MRHPDRPLPFQPLPTSEPMPIKTRRLGMPLQPAWHVLRTEVRPLHRLLLEQTLPEQRRLYHKKLREQAWLRVRLQKRLVRVELWNGRKRVRQQSLCCGTRRTLHRLPWHTWSLRLYLQIDNEREKLRNYRRYLCEWSLFERCQLCFGLWSHSGEIRLWLFARVSRRELRGRHQRVL